MSERKDAQHGGTLSTEQANLKGYAMGILLGGIFGDLKSLPEQARVPGKHTGDAAMVFCLVDALADTEHGAQLDPIKLRQNFDRWYLKGAHRSMDKNHELTLLGKTLKNTFESFTPTESSPLVPLQIDGINPGSAAVLRTAPVAIKYHDDAKSCLLAAYVQSKTTHGHPETAHCAMLFAFLLYRALGLVKEGIKPELGLVLGGRSPVVDEINQHLRTMCANDRAWLKKHYIQNGQRQLLQEFPSDMLKTVSCLASSDSRSSWNWKSNNFLQARDMSSAGPLKTVNCLDALAVSLHVLHTQGSLLEQAPEKFEQAVLLCSQLPLGSNSLAILVCQLVGALYGTVSQGPPNPPAWFAAVQQLLARPSPREFQDGGWFELLFGFKERVSGDGLAFAFNQQQYASSEAKIGSESAYIIRQRTKDSRREFIAGNFEVPTLRDLRQEVLALAAQRRKAVNSKDALARVSDVFGEYEYLVTEVEKDKIRERQQVGLVTNAEVPFAKREDNRFVLREAQESQLVHQKVQIPAEPGGEPALRICITESSTHIMYSKYSPHADPPPHTFHRRQPWLVTKACGEPGQAAPHFEYTRELSAMRVGRAAAPWLQRPQLAICRTRAYYTWWVLELLYKEATDKESQELAGAVQAVLTRAEEQKFDWISIPAISTGISGFPRKKGTKIILEACAKFCLDFKPRHLKEIRLVNIDAETTQDLVSALESLNFY
eukprot:g76878.t1